MKTSPGSSVDSSVDSSLCTRRDALALLAAGGLAACGGTLRAAPEDGDELTFFVIADPQIHLDK